MGTTPTYLLPYPELDEPDDVPTDMHELASRIEALLPGFQVRSEEGAPNGYAGLDAGGKVPVSQIPAAALQAVVVKRKVTEKAVVNSSAKTDLFNNEFTINPGELSPTGIMRIVANGDHMNGTGSTRALPMELKVGGSVLWDSGSTPIVSVASPLRGWRFTAEVWAIAGTPSAMQLRAGGMFLLGDVALATTGTGALNDVGTGHFYAVPFLGIPVTVDMSSGRPLTWSITHPSQSNALSTRLEHARVEISG